MQRVEIRGCLPALLVLALLGAVALAFTVAGVALALPLLALFFAVGVVRAVWRGLTGHRAGRGQGQPPAPPPGTIEVVEREPAGPVVDVGPPPRDGPRTE